MASNMMFDDEIMPIEIRPGHMVLIKGVPWDLTKAEAEKTANVVLALGCDHPKPPQVDMRSIIGR